MEIKTAWVKPPIAIGGLDHLAVQAPCISLYGRMLPGITNVTDRARYYSFYPWVVWALEKRGHRYDNTFIDLFRKADCLFTLIAERHAKVAGGDRDDHAAATVGSGNMSEQIAKVKEGHSVTLSDSAHRSEGKNRYFKNKLGGLGQYYIGVFRELHIMDGDLEVGVKNIREIGGSIAETLNRSVKGELFLNTIEEDIVAASRLDELHEFCPCALNSSPEELAKLYELFFVRGPFFNQSALARRHTLQMILSLTGSLAQVGVSIDIEQFRGCTYSGTLPGGITWKLPEHLLNIRRQWAIYQRNEILSMAVQGIFYVILDSYQDSGKRFHSVDELVGWFLDTPEVAQIGSFFALDTSVASLQTSIENWLPALANWNNNDHEVRLASRIESLCRSKSMENRSAILLACLKVLLALKNRPETNSGYGDFMWPPDYFKAYPINLQTFLHYSCNKWNPLTVRDWLGWLTSEWGIKTHLFVALRKLRGQSQSTFRIRPSDKGLEIISVPEAVFTSPRFRQTLRVLKDIGAIARKDKVWILSDRGMQFMELTDE